MTNRQQIARLSERRRSLIRSLRAEGVARLHSLQPDDREKLLQWLPDAIAAEFPGRKWLLRGALVGPLAEGRLTVTLEPEE